MDVILLEDVKKLGKKGEVIKVSDGYARNFILPKKLGVEATAKNINDLRLQKEHDKKLAQEMLEEAKALAAKIEEKPVVLAIKTGEGGRSFGSVSTKEIAKAVTDQLKLEIDKKKMVLENPIKTLGTHTVTVKLHKDVTAQLTVKVVEE
ncbi:50S ribosomal protein L9 [Parasporobacterium paucivorans]|uniref:Large ribosomal subunit protein bL9 n=1 Tax=Parasporobacterium paucivorans DSM 15970 TaxID=1122934 RepID=A0A1M6J2B0_9FIRM|nr:50S ribosomal protein L9 [Parasporobacterium paucivorans]SHJ40864.1 LSU ribosomal protein L9P [Parasporobacterium paucivorans DSM 15970]